MPVILHPVARNSDTDPEDIRLIKNALNRLGYYKPDPDIGVNGWPDDQLFQSIADFQKDHDLDPTGALKPDDATTQSIDQVIEDDPHVFYIWHSVEDDLVRPEHSKREGEIFAWDDPPEGGNPGEDYNCRCWAELISDNEILKEKLKPQNLERKKIPGTNIPDFGIPEQGWSAIKKFNPYKSEPDPLLDIEIGIIPPKTIDERMPVYEEIPWLQNDKST